MRHGASGGRRVGIGLGALGLAALVVACSESLDFSSVSQPAKDGGADGSSSSSGGGSGSGSGGGDSGGGDGGGGGFCAGFPGADLCDDFDDPQRPLGAVWDGIEQTNGVAAVDTVAAVSGASSLETSSSAIPTGGSVRAVVKKFFPADANEKVAIDVQFEMRVEDFDPATTGGQVVAFALLFGPDDNYNQLVLNLNSTGSAVVAQLAENAVGADANGYAVHGPFPDKPPVGKWLRVHIQLDVQDPHGTGNTLKVFFDDVAEFEGSLSVPLKGDQPRMELGIGWAAAPAAPWKVRYDDFVATLKPL